MNFSVAAQITVLILAALSILWGCFAIYGVIAPGGSGEWTGLAVFAAAVVDIPAGLLALAVGFLVKKGSPRLRRLCLASAAMTFLLPVVAQVLWHYHIHF